MKKLIEFFGILLFVSLLIACPLLCGLSLVYKWEVVGTFLFILLSAEFFLLWFFVKNEIERKKE